MPGATTAIQGTDLKWKRVYKPKTRQVLRSEVETHKGKYTMRELRHFVYVLSYTPTLGEEIDLGEFRHRRDCDQRVREHIAQA